MDTPDDALVARLFGEYLEAAEAGRDAEAEVLARAGENRGALTERIRLDRALHRVARGAAPASGAPAPPPRESAPPGSIGRFQILGTIGSGGVGTVYRANDPRLARRVALKVLHPEIVDLRGGAAWVLNEARSLAGLEHPGVVRVFDVGEAEGKAFMAMELLSGPSLAQVIRALRPPRPDASGSALEPSPGTRELAARLAPFTARVDCLARIAEALAYCHDQGVLHRDVKPDNILFDADGHPKLIDFGLAHHEGADEDSRLDLTQRLVGTPSYVSPEQLENKRTGADPRSDQFSFATLAYEFVALENPFHGKTYGERMDAIARCQPRPLRAVVPAVPPDLARVLQHGHERLPGERYPDMAALAADLRAILEHRPISVSVPSPGHVARLWLRRHRRSVVLAGILSSAMALIGITAWCGATAQTRTTVRAGIAGIHPEEFERPGEFYAVLGTLLKLQGSAHDFDASWIRRWFWGALYPEVDGVVRIWSERLGRNYERERVASVRSALPFQELLYQRLFAFEEILCPDCPFNLTFRGHGRVVLPLEELERAGLRHELDQLVPVDDPKDKITVFRSTEYEEFLQPGTYRLQAWKPGTDELAFESHFLVVPGWLPPLRVELRPPLPELIEQTILVEGTRYDLPHGPRLAVPAFRILGRFVTIAEFRRFQLETGIEGSVANVADGDPAEPAFVDFHSAVRMAAWAGGRLPSVAELQVALDGNALAGLDQERSPGEYVLDLAMGRASFVQAWFRYANWRLGNRAIISLVGAALDPAGPLSADLPSLVASAADSPRGTKGFVCFRIAYSADRPERYRELVVTPMEQR